MEIVEINLILVEMLFNVIWWKSVDILRWIFWDNIRCRSRRDDDISHNLFINFSFLLLLTSYVISMISSKLFLFIKASCVNLKSKIVLKKIVGNKACNTGYSHSNNRKRLRTVFYWINQLRVFNISDSEVINK